MYKKIAELVYMPKLEGGTCPSFPQLVTPMHRSC